VEREAEPKAFDMGKPEPQIRFRFLQIIYSGCQFSMDQIILEQEPDICIPAPQPWLQGNDLG